MSFINTRAPIDLGGIGERTTLDGLIDGTLTEFKDNMGITINKNEILRSHTGLKTLVLPNITLSYGSFLGCTSLITARYGWAGSTNQFNGCTSLIAAEARGLNQATFSGCTKFNILVLRSTGTITLGNISCFNNTPFASGKAGGTLYVPESRISSYQSATNWSTILGYANNQIKSIESTHTDPVIIQGVPIDLTLYYIDGEPIG